MYGPCEAMTIIIMADPNMWSVQAATAGIRPIFSPPALTNIQIILCGGQLVLHACADGFLRRLWGRVVYGNRYFGEGCSVSRHDIYMHVMAFTRGAQGTYNAEAYHATVSRVQGTLLLNSSVGRPLLCH